MRDVLRADVYRMFCKRWFWICVCFLEALSVALLVIQHTAMDYSVGLDRVVFLPMSFYGVAVAALIGLYVGDDFFDGMMPIKIVAGKLKSAIYWSAQIVCWLGCAAAYTLMTATTAAIGICVFPVNITSQTLAVYYALGLFTCIAYGSIFCMASMIIKNRSLATVLCMAGAFAMLFLCLHTNQVLMQTAVKDGLPNPAYVTGIKRVVYLYLHDINPCGQAAQLSGMHCNSPVRFMAVDVAWACLSGWVGAKVFCMGDIR